MAAAFGLKLGIVAVAVAVAVASILGFAAIVNTSVVALLAIKYLGVTYLFVMAQMILRENDELKIDNSLAQVRHPPTALKGTLLNAPNPKLSLFFFALLPQFLPKQ